MYWKICDMNWLHMIYMLVRTSSYGELRNVNSCRIFLMFSNIYCWWYRRELKDNEGCIYVSLYICVGCVWVDGWVSKWNPHHEESYRYTDLHIAALYLGFEYIWNFFFLISGLKLWFIYISNLFLFFCCLRI